MAINQNKIPPYQEGYQTGPLNRADQIRRDNDTVVTPKVTLYDVDYAILYHLGQNMKLQVRDGDRMISVPVIYGDGEKWAQIRSRGYMRDTTNKVIAPIVVIRRQSVDADPRIPIMDLNNYVPHVKFFPYVQMNMQYDRITKQHERKPSYEFYMVDAPNYIRVSYEVVVWTDMIEQLNTVIQAILAVSNHLWGDYYSFRTVVDSISMNTLNNVGEDRVVSATVSLTVDAWLRDEFEYHEPTMRKAYSIKKVNFQNEQEDIDPFIDEPYPFASNSHISSEPKHLQLMRKQRNLRYR